MKRLLIITGGQASGKTDFLYSLIDAFGEKSIIISEDQVNADQVELHPGTEMIALDGVTDGEMIKAIATLKPFGDVFVVVSTQLPASEFPESPYYKVHEMISFDGR